MSTAAIKLPLLGQQAGFRRFSVDEYHDLIADGYLTADDRLELIEGYLVLKMSRNPPHDLALQRLNKRLMTLVPASVEVRIQSAITLSDSEPEPDAAVVRGPDTRYQANHPQPADISLVIEVSDSTLDGDRTDKVRIYSRAGIVCYWIVNLVDRQVEVYTSPTGVGANSEYGQRQDYHSGDSAPLILDGVTVATIPVADLLP